MKAIITALLVIFTLLSCENDKKISKSNKIVSTEVNELLLDSIYETAMAYYDSKDYKKSAQKFDYFFKENGNLIYNNGIYNAACTYALNNENEKALKWLKYLVEEKYYSNLNHIKTDTDLTKLHKYPEWKSILKKAKYNLETEPERKREKIKSELFKANNILNEDNGKLWGANLWNPNILVIDYDKSIYSLVKLPNSRTKDSVLFYSKFIDNELSFTNTTQDFKGKKYATVMINAISDSSATLIHELFHLTHFTKNSNLRANPIEYLDKLDARLLLRLEYQALKNALSEADNNTGTSTVTSYLKDALIFRKTRQEKYKAYIDEELELETVEGLANYTGIKLSTIPNLYQRTINEINVREAAETYTRPFPYATGPAYGILFDYLKINWRQGFDKVYNYLEIYEKQFLKDQIVLNVNELLEAKRRNNFKKINEEETNRKLEFDKLIMYYTNKLITEPTLKASTVNKDYSMSFNMNGTLILDDYGIVYSGIKGTDHSNKNFGDFHINEGNNKLGEGGVLKLKNTTQTTYIFSKPIKITGNKIYGDFYEIELNKGWKVVTLNEKGDMEIVKE